MALWMVRAGEKGKREHVFFENNIVGIGWKDLPNLSRVRSKEELPDLYRRTYPEDSKAETAVAVGQIWRFIHEIQRGDLVTVPLKSQSAVAIGQITGDYEYRQLPEDTFHTRPVKWLKTIPRSELPRDILYSLGAYMTVCRIERNEAEARIRRLLEGEKWLFRQLKKPLNLLKRFMSSLISSRWLETRLLSISRRSLRATG